MATKKTKAPTRTKSTKKQAVAPKIARRAEAAPTENTLGRREQLIAVAAYLRAEQRGFTPGHELEDWLAAETEIDAGVGA